MPEPESIDTLIDDVSVNINSAKKSRGHLKQKVKSKKRSMDRNEKQSIISSSRMEISRLEEKIEVYRRVLDKLNSIQSSLNTIQKDGTNYLQESGDIEKLERIQSEAESISVLSDHIDSNFNGVARISARASDRLEDLDDD